MKKKLISMSAILLSFTMLLASCGTSGGSATNPSGDTTSTETTATDATAESETDAAAADWTSLRKYDPPITMTVNRFITPEELEEQGGSMEMTGGWADWARETLGINYEIKWVAVDDSDQSQKLQLGIASGDMPDVIPALTPTLIQQLASTDRIYVMEDLIEQYGSPLTKYFMQEYDKSANNQGFKAVTYNDKYYASPIIFDTFQVASYTQWIRKDIVDSLGMEMPKTITDFENILAKYKESNPSGVGYILSMDNENTDSVLYAPYGAYPKHWINKDGEAVYGSIQPEVKEGLKMLREWYKKGYIDVDFVSKDFWTQSAAFTDGRALSMSSPYWGYGWSFPVLNRAVPESVVEPMALLNGPNGEETEGIYMNFTTPWPAAISKQFATPEASIYELNMALDSYFRNSADLREQFDFHYPETEPREPINPDVVAAEGMDEAIFDYPSDIFGPGFLNEGNPSGGGPALVAEKSRPNAIVSTSIKVYEALENGTFDELPLEDRNYYSSNIMQRENMQGNEMSARAHFLNAIQSQKYFSENKLKYDLFLGAPTETMQIKNEYLTKIELETFANIITGNVELDEFDKFVENWKENGGDEVTQEVNEWYKNNK